MNPELQILLNSASPDRLRSIVQGLYGQSAHTDNMIEAQLLRDNPKALAKQIKKRIQSIKRGRRFIDYRHSNEFSSVLDAVAGDITGLLETEPKLAFELSDSLMATHSGVFSRSDDSSGAIGDSYHNAVELWLAAAELWRRQGVSCKVDWPRELLLRHQTNDYGMWDNVIANSDKLLTCDELTQLAWRFEADAKRALKEQVQEGYNFNAAEHTLGLAAVAEALKDVALYERSILLTSPAPNDLQKRSIIEFCLSVNDGHTALKWLDTPWEARFKADQYRLRDKTLMLLGQHDVLITLRRSVYEAEPNFERLTALIEVVPTAEQGLLQQQAVEKTLTISDAVSRINTLLKLEAFEQAAQQTLLCVDTLNNVMYSTLLAWAKAFTQAKYYLAAAACYRCLLEEILNEGRSKAYNHAAKYYQCLAALDDDISNYQSLMSWADYQLMLRDKHGRKSAFWGRLD